jgi:hypothetical protein
LVVETVEAVRKAREAYMYQRYHEQPIETPFSHYEEKDVVNEVLRKVNQQLEEKMNSLNNLLISSRYKLHAISWVDLKRYP